MAYILLMLIVAAICFGIFAVFTLKSEIRLATEKGTETELLLHRLVGNNSIVKPKDGTINVQVNH